MGCGSCGEKEELKCPTCGATFKTKDKMMEHKKSHM
jgi:uncharacterized C2H2 Zn-finger protein